MVNIGSFLASGALFFFLDFNGNRLDLANKATSDSNPIISFSADALGSDSNQKVNTRISFLLCTNSLDVVT